MVSSSISNKCCIRQTDQLLKNYDNLTQITMIFQGKTRISDEQN